MMKIIQTWVVCTNFDIYVLIDTDTAVQTGDVNLVLSVNTSSLSEMIWSGD